jgi:hypothetical protein
MARVLRPDLVERAIRRLPGLKARAVNERGLQGGFRLLGAERERYERLLPDADPKFAEAHLQGNSLSFEEAVAHAEWP